MTHILTLAHPDVSVSDTDQVVFVLEFNQTKILPHISYVESS